MDQPLIEAMLADKAHPLHAYHMGLALGEAGRAYDEAEVPIGAVIVHRQHGLVGSAHNQPSTRTGVLSNWLHVGRHGSDSLPGLLTGSWTATEIVTVSHGWNASDCPYSRGA